MTGGGADGGQVSPGGSPGAACPAPSTARALAPPRARITCGRGRGCPSRLRRLWPPARLGREVGARSEEAETAAAPAGPRSEPRGCMARPARLCGLWALLLCATVSPGAAATGECAPRLVTATRRTWLAGTWTGGQGALGLPGVGWGLDCRGQGVRQGGCHFDAL